MTAVDGRTQITLRVMRMDTAVNSGNSGGGLFNHAGELIGIGADLMRAAAEKAGYAVSFTPIEEDTLKVRAWLETLDVNSLTMSDKAIVDEMNMIYFMMTASQKAFISEELAAKLVAAVDKLAAMQA